PPARARRKKNEGPQAIGRSHGGATTKIHLICSRNGCPLRFSVTSGNRADGPAGMELLGSFTTLGGRKYIIADRGYDSYVMREKIASLGAIPVIPARSCWHKENRPRCNRRIYKRRSKIEN